MPKAITHDETVLIANLIRDWPHHIPFKWETICDSVKSILGYVPTRQGLHKKPMLANAYESKKRQLRNAKKKFPQVSQPKSMSDAVERIAKLQDENDLLKLELQKMAEIANRFIYNASIAGLSRDRLMAPLPSKAKG